MEFEVSLRRAASSNWDGLLNWLFPDKGQQCRRMEEILNFQPTIVLLISNGSGLCAAGVLIPAFHECNKEMKEVEANRKFYLSRRAVGKLEHQVWELRFYGNGKIFQSLKKIFSIAPQDDANEEIAMHCFREKLSQLKKKLKKELRNSLIVVDSEVARDAQFFIKCLNKVEPQSSEFNSDRVEGYSTLLLK